jgi:hypothetical protein
MVAKEDISKIGTGKPIKMMVKTNVFPNNKERFIEFFEDLEFVCGM